MKRSAHVRLGTLLILAALGLTVVWIAGYVALDYYVDALWFGAVGYARVFWTMLRTRVSLAALAGALAYAALHVNLRIARRFSLAPDPRMYARLELDPLFVDRVTRATLTVCALFVSLLVGLSVAKNWMEFLRFRYAVPFGLEDPVFGHDVGFYVFRLPAIAYVCQAGLVLVLLCMGAVVAQYFVRGSIDLSGERRVLTDAAFGHLSILSGALALLFACRCWLARYQVLFAKRGAVCGAGYADVHAQVGACAVAALAAVALGVWLIANGYLRRRPANLYALGTYVALWAAVAVAFPAAVQTFVVKPNEFAREEPYLARNIEFTRRAYGLEDVDVRPWPGDGIIDAESIAAHPGTVDNLLLWDPAPLLDMYNQKQRIRLYYNFMNVDADRYVIDGKLRPVMTAVRELDARQLPEKSLVWTNLHLQYTHGYGACLSLGNRAVAGGLPEFLVSNLPPETIAKIDLEQPRIYYGEQTPLYALTHGKPEEFDYPGDPENHFNRYDGGGGVRIKGLMRRAILSWYTGDKEILFTDQFTDQSRILLFRNVRERVGKIAPFMHFDEDPYPVLLGGRVVWVLDGYTLTRRFPYSEAVGIANYWRNAVKATVDAYDGTVTLYRFDSEDPLLQAYERIFPGIFRSMDEMPEDLRAHLRYPQDLFRVQTALYRRYHMDDPRLFFTGEDMWTFPKSGVGAAASFEPPRYLVLELPGSGAAEQFVLSRTFTVEGKDNMIAWMAAGCDPDHYGTLTVYQLPKQRNIYGPTQAKGRFNQDPGVSQFMTLMGQLGSVVVQSKVLAVPINEGLLYLLSLYVEDPQVKIPELKQVVLGHGDRVAMAPTIGEALASLFDPGARPPAVDETSTEEAAAPCASQVPDAATLYHKAVERLKAGDWAGFGEAFNALGKALGAEP